jgi:hypothetical protein
MHKHAHRAMWKIGWENRAMMTVREHELLVGQGVHTNEVEVLDSALNITYVCKNLCKRHSCHWQEWHIICKSSSAPDGYVPIVWKQIFKYKKIQEKIITYTFRCYMFSQNILEKGTFF